MGAGGGDEPPSASSFSEPGLGFQNPDWVFRTRTGFSEPGLGFWGPAGNAPKIKEASGALDRDPTLHVPGRDTSLTPRGLSPPGRTRLGFLCNRLRPPGKRPQTLATTGNLALRPCPLDPGKTKNPRTNPPVRGSRTVFRPPQPPDRAERIIRTRPAAGRTAKSLTPCGVERFSRPARASSTREPPASRPRRTLPAKDATAGLNDAPPKGWRSSRRRCFRRLAIADSLQNRCPPGPC